MKLRTLVLLLAGVATLGVWAAPVDEDDVAAAANGWLRMRTSALGVNLGGGIDRSALALCSTTNDATYYRLKTSSGATIFMNSDDRLEPVMGFTDEDVGEIAPESPLGALLNDHVSIANAVLLLDKSDDSGSASANSAKWAALIRKGNLDSASAIQTESGISDMRVNTLVAAKWNQTVVGAQACYNYYTPNGPDEENFMSGRPDNAPCGCVATAMSQLMWYHRYPYENNEVESRFVTWVAASGEQTILRLPMKTGIYYWEEHMPAEPQNISEDDAKAIGMLTYNAGLAVNMRYANAGSSAYTCEAGEALKDQFRYTSAYCAMISGAVAAGGGTRRDALGRVMFANFNAGLPVLVSLPGHAVVADGYGFVEDVDYVHFNMGWSGQHNFWYNIPDLTAAGSAYTAIDYVVYNIYPQFDESRAVLSGRVVDDENNPCASANVAIYDEADNLVQELVASQYGVWGAVLPPGSYRVRATTADGMLAGDSELQSISTPGATSYTITGGNRSFRRVNGSFGNVWDADVQVANPSVRLYRDGTLIDTFSSFDRALREVENQDGDDGFEVVVFAPTYMVAPVTVTKKISVRIDGDPAVNLINVLPTAIGSQDGRLWFLQIADGAEATLADTVFDLGGEAGGVDVLSGGVLKISGAPALGDKISLHWSEGLVLAGELTRSLLVDCETGGGFGESFGRVETFAGAAESAKLLCNVGNAELFGGINGDRLVWSIGEVPDDMVAARLEQDGTAVNFMSLRHLFSAVTNDARVVLLKNCTLESAVVVSNQLVLASETNRQEQTSTVPVRRQLSVGQKVSFSLLAGADLRLENIVVQPADGPAFAQSGALFSLEDAASAMTLGSNACITNLNVVGNGLVSVGAGRLTMNRGAKITHCTSTGKGGAVYLGGAGAAFDFLGGEIVHCTADDLGGGVYVANGATVTVSGGACAKDNVSRSLQADFGDACGDCNIYFASTKATDPPALVVKGSLSGYVGVYYKGRTTSGAAFAVPANAEAAITDSPTLCALVCDWLDPDDPQPLEATYDEQSACYCWQAGPSGPRPVNQELADVRIDVEGAAAVYYERFEDALDVATNQSEIVVLRDAEWNESRELAVDLSLRGENGAVLRRKAAVTLTVPSGKSLTIGGLTIDGADAPAAGPMALHVNDGTLILDDGARIVNHAGAANRAAGAVVAENGATVELRSGAAIRDCRNDFVNEAEGTGCGGAILADRSTVRLRGGEIRGCRAYRGGGVYLGNGSSICVGGEVEVVDNYDLAGTRSDVVAQNSSGCIRYCAQLAGTVGCRAGVNLAETNVFGVVEQRQRDGDFEALAAGATNFFNDVTLSRGVLATNSTGTAAVLVWAQALDANGQIAVADDAGEAVVYTAASEIPDDYDSGAGEQEPVACVPFAVTGLDRNADGSWRLRLSPGVKYCIYTLWTGVNLVDWTQSGEPQKLSADGEFEFAGDGADAVRFWKVTGADGVKPAGE